MRANIDGCVTDTRIGYVSISWTILTFARQRRSLPGMMRQSFAASYYYFTPSRMGHGVDAVRD
jgi:hypothetical protein